MADRVGCCVLPGVVADRGEMGTALRRARRGWDVGSILTSPYASESDTPGDGEADRAPTNQEAARPGADRRTARDAGIDRACRVDALPTEPALACRRENGRTS